MTVWHLGLWKIVPASPLGSCLFCGIIKLYPVAGLLTPSHPSKETLPLMKSSFKSVLVAVVATVFWVQTTPAVVAAGKEAISQSANPQPLDPGWPREITRNGIRLVYYQPQVHEWKNFRELRARFAFTLTPKEGKSAVGIEEVRGNTVADLQTRTVLIDNIEIVAVRFPSLAGAEGRRWKS
jgi:hypothetical protein